MLQLDYRFRLLIASIAEKTEYSMSWCNVPLKNWRIFRHAAWVDTHYPRSAAVKTVVKNYIRVHRPCWWPVNMAREHACSAYTDPKSNKTRNQLKFAGVPQTGQSISAVSGPKFAILRGQVEEVLLLNVFFRLSIRALSRGYMCNCYMQLLHAIVACNNCMQQLHM